MGRERNVSVYHHTMIMIVILRVHCVVRIMGIVATQCELLSCLMHLFEKKNVFPCSELQGRTRIVATQRELWEGKWIHYFFSSKKWIVAMPHASRLRHGNSEHTCFGQGRAWINSIRCLATNFQPSRQLMLVLTFRRQALSLVFISDSLR